MDFFLSLFLFIILSRFQLDLNSVRRLQGMCDISDIHVEIHSTV